MVCNKSVVYKCLACFLLYLAHKIFYICVPTLVAYVLFFSRISKILRGGIILGLTGWFLYIGFALHTIDNGGKFLYKTKEGNLLGWFYAIFINLVYLFLFLMILFHLPQYKYFTNQERHVFLCLLIFIILLDISFIACYNYLTLNRHNTNVLILWVIAVLMLLEKKFQKNLIDK